MSQTNYVLWEDLAVGQIFPSAEYVVSNEDIQKYLLATLDDSEIYQNQMKSAQYGFDRLPAPPTMAAIFIRKAYVKVPAPPGGIHAKQQFKLIRPAMAGDVLTTTLKITNKFIKKERKYVELQGETINQSGEMICSSLMTTIWAK